MEEIRELNSKVDIQRYLSNFTFSEAADFFDKSRKTKIEISNYKNGVRIEKYLNEFWTLSSMLMIIG